MTFKIYVSDVTILPDTSEEYNIFYYRDSAPICIGRIKIQKMNKTLFIGSCEIRKVFTKVTEILPLYFGYMHADRHEFTGLALYDQQPANNKFAQIKDNLVD